MAVGLEQAKRKSKSSPKKTESTLGAAVSETKVKSVNNNESGGSAALGSEKLSEQPIQVDSSAKAALEQEVKRARKSGGSSSARPWSKSSRYQIKPLKRVVNEARGRAKDWTDLAKQATVVRSIQDAQDLLASVQSVGVASWSGLKSALSEDAKEQWALIRQRLRATK